MTARPLYFLLLLPLYCLAIDCSNSDSSEYGIIIDAGSTGSRMYFYKWAAHQTGIGIVQPEIVIPENSSRFSADKGISQFKEIREAVLSIERLVKFAIQEFNQCADKVRKIPIFLKATGGVRSLPENTADELMEKIRSLFRDSSFAFQNQYVEILSGNEEAEFAWLTVQYLTGKLKTDSQTYGVLDLGGASTQIAFKSDSISEDAVSISFGDYQEKIYGVSFLNFGDSFARKRMVNEMASKADNRKIGKFPCWFSGYFEIEPASGVNMTGTSDFQGCMDLISTMVKSDSSNCAYSNCTIGTVYQPQLPKGMKFYAIDAFYNAVKNLQLEENVTLNQLESKLKSVCSKDYSQITSEFYEILGKSLKYASDVCWIASYSLSLFKRYGFPADEVVLQFSDNINGIPITWTTGAMLKYSNELTKSQPLKNSNLSKSAWIGIIFSVSILCILITALIARTHYLKKLRRKIESSSTKRNSADSEYIHIDHCINK